MLNNLETSNNESVIINPMMQDGNYTISPFGNQNLKVKPKYLKLLLSIVSNYSENIFNYLSLKDLCLTRGINRMFLALVHEYYQKRLKIEIQTITSYQNFNQEKTSIFMKNIDSQIPISNKNWLDFDLNSVTKTIQSLSRSTVTQLRSIKNLGKYSDSIYAPFCIIFGYNKTNNPKVKSDGWKKTAGIILNDANFFIKASKLDLENFNDNDILEAFVALNLPELDIDVVKRYSPALGKLLKWCQAVVSYHILIHPYTYRNDKSQIEEGGDVYEFAQNMNFMINRFYKFKRFLFKLGIIKIPLGDYVFNLQHSRELASPHVQYDDYLTEKFIGNILSYLPINQSFKFISVNKKFLGGFKSSLDEITLEILKEIFYFKHQAYDKLYKKIPMLYENNIFSKYFLMLDDILNTECDCNEQGTNYIPFLTKEQLNDIKKLKIENEPTNIICKVLCVLLDEKPQRKADSRGEIKNLYIQKVKLLAINGSLTKLMRAVNKLELNKNQIKVLSENMLKFYSNEKLEEIKRVNRGLYQLLIWELYIFEYLKEFNPFSLVNIDLLLNTQSFENEEVEMIKYYIELMNFLKYNLKAKYHFHSVNLSSLSKMPSFDFQTLVHDLYNYLQSQNLSSDILFDTSNPDHGKISTVYFESKDLIPQAAKPALYERIMIEIVSTSLSTSREGTSEVNTSKNNAESNLCTIKEENSIINNNINKEMKVNYQNAIITSIGSNYNTNNSNYNTNFDSNNISNVTFESIGNDILIKNILFFLDINSLPNFSLVNKRCNKCIKTHIVIRIFFLNKEKRIIEEEHSDILSSIDGKRENFFSEYEMQPPTKEHACSLMSEITNDDILEIKQFFRRYNKTYEKVIAPLVVLLGGKAKNGYNIDGSKSVSYFIPAQKIIYKRDFVRKIQNLELETIPIVRFNQAERLMQDSVFNESKIKSLSPCLSHLISWLMGVIEFHRVVRKYSLSYYDYDILDKDELKFCGEMDNILLLYYKLLRYANKYCKKYEKAAEEIMKTMDIPVDDEEEDN